ncbi:MAG: hypothetical protein ACI9G1_001474 [Pirellulaceae bacterium]
MNVGTKATAITNQLPINCLQRRLSGDTPSMTPFQWICIACLGSLTVIELARMFWGRGSKRNTLLRGIVWLAALVAISMPHLLSDIAHIVGINRGADLVLYTLCLTFFMTTFFIYSCYVRLRNEMTLLVRHMAIREARRGDHEQATNERLS